MSLNERKRSTNDFAKICRVCLISSDFLSSMSSQFLKLYTQLLNMPTGENDNLPEKICKDCDKEMESVALFVEKCKNNYVFLALQLEEDKDKCSSPVWDITDDLSNEDLLSTHNKNNGDYIVSERDGLKNDNLIVNIESDCRDSGAKSKKFCCANCNKEFYTKKELIVHVKVHSDSKPFSCQDCNMKFKFRQSLQRHRLIHSGIKAFKCDICGKGFKRAFSRNKHRRIHARVKPSADSKYNCLQCDRILTSYSALSSHMKTHTGEKPYSCSYCEKRFPYVSSLTVHTRLHTGETPFICSICNKGYRSSTSLKKHKEVKHFEITDIKGESENEDDDDKDKDIAKDNSKRECKICNKILNKHGFGTHMRIHRVVKKQFICISCNKTFQKNSHLERHYRIHTGERPYVCKLCGKTFKQDGDLKRHVVSHTGEKKFQCQHCGKQYYTKGSLVSHITGIHTGERKPVDSKCNICQKSFKQCNHSQNNGEKPYLCTICGKSFTASSTLKVHTRIHTGETPFMCTYCSKGYHNSSSLKRHVMRNHTGEKPYVCMICQKGFHDSTNMKRHIKRIHSVLEIKKE